MDQNTNVSSGSLKTKIVLRNGISQFSMPFYGMKPELPPPSKILGSDDLLARFDLSSAYQRFCGPNRPKDDLASFLTNIYGISKLGIKDDQSSSLMRLIEKPPITGREIVNLSSSALSGFKLAPGPLAENCKFFDVLPGDAALLSVGHSSNNASGSGHANAAVSGAALDPSKSKKRLKRSLDVIPCPEPEKKAKKHRSGEEKKLKKRKRKEKKHRKQDADGGGDDV